MITTMIVLSAVAFYLAGALLTARVATPRFYRRRYPLEEHRVWARMTEARHHRCSTREDSDYVKERERDLRLVAADAARTTRNYIRPLVAWLAVLWPVIVGTIGLGLAVVVTWRAVAPVLAYPRRWIARGWRLLVARPCSYAAEFAFRAPIRELEEK
jgi:hypothetical protein